MKWSEREPDFTVEYDEELTAELNRKAREKYGTSKPRVATHASDLFYCLRKSWQRIRDARDGIEEDPDDATLWTWAGGLLFEEWASEGETQARMGWCPECDIVEEVDGHAEVVDCPICGNRWLLATPDDIVGGVIREYKQTRKSSRYGLEKAPNYIDQLRTYLLFDHLKNYGEDRPNYGQLVADWIMGDYGAKGGKDISQPPRAVLNAHRVTFEEGFESAWAEELERRKNIVEGEQMPPLNGMGEGDEMSPQYEWECGTCPVGLKIECPNYLWDGEGMLKED